MWLIPSHYNKRPLYTNSKISNKIRSLFFCFCLSRWSLRSRRQCYLTWPDFYVIPIFMWSVTELADRFPRIIVFWSGENRLEYQWRRINISTKVQHRLKNFFRGREVKNEKLAIINNTAFLFWRYIYIHITLMLGVWCHIVLSVFTCVISVHLGKAIKSISCVGASLVRLLLFPVTWDSQKVMLPKGQGIFYPSRRFVCRLSLAENLLRIWLKMKIMIVRKE
jgi:hypothetical protein